MEDFDKMEADEAQNTILNAILDFKDFESIENLYIDLKFIQDFVPSEIYNLEVYIPITHLIGTM